MIREIIRANIRAALVMALIAVLMISTGCSIDPSSIGASVLTTNQSVEENTDDSESSDDYDEYDEEEDEDLDMEEDEQAIEESKLNCTVWVTKTGSFYHMEGCRYLKSKAGSMTQKEAIDKGYSPCSKCISSYFLPNYKK